MENLPRIIALSMIISFTLVLSAETSNSEILALLKSYQEHGYKDVRPNNLGKAVSVNISMFIIHITSISEVDMDFTADLYLRQTWTDNRLAFNGSDELKEMILSPEFIKNIWIPDTFFSNSKQTALHTSTNLQNNAFIRIKSNGDVFYSLRLTVVTVCPMNLRNFPMDTQTCYLQLESYGYTAEDLDYFWMDYNVSRSYLELPNFRVMCSFNDKANIYLGRANYSRLMHRIVIDRSLGYYLNQIYIPAIFTVVISWIPFWLDRDDNHARVGLGVTTVLTMTTLVTNTNAAMPKISYMKSLDIYLEVCFAMVFASLLQYATVGYCTARTHKASHWVEKDMIFTKNRKIWYIKRNPSRLDVHSRWLFPTIFILFNFCYWTIYLILPKSDYCSS